jgi:glycosyltransferase involved in cell wall biosynthesis
VRILFLSTSMGLGGADQQLLSAAQVLRDRGHEIRIVSLTPLGPMGLQARSLGLATDSLEMRRGVPDPRGLARLVRIVRAWKPDVVHSHMVHANLMARVLRLLVPVPVLVSTIHNVYEGGPLLMAGYRLTNGLVDHMTIISQAAADRFVGERIVPGRLLTVIANGVDTDRMRNLPPEGRAALRGWMSVGDQDFVWLAVGRFEVAKDYPNMLRAFAAVRAREPRAVLVIVGQGSLQAEAEALTAELGLREAVRFLGARDDVPAVMSAADGYVMSSAWEGMPMVLLEAEAAGLPIVATAVGGNGEVVRDGESGFLVPARDSEGLRAGMLRLMALPEEQRRAMGERGREHVRANYGLQRVAERWERVYWDALARKGFTLEPSASRSSPHCRPASAGGREGGHR